jgi:murein DD-endopeptidase MepM/ murein hydrolase activator NlpD
MGLQAHRCGGDIVGQLLIHRHPSSGTGVAAQLAAAVNRHRQALATAFVTLLSGFAVTAFGIAPMAPDAANLPRTTVAQPVEPAGLPGQLLALAAQNLVLSRTELTRPSDSADTLLRRLGIFDPSLATFMRANNDTRRLFEGKPGKQVQARVDADGAAFVLVARFAPPNVALQTSHFTRVTIDRSTGSWRANAELVPLQAQVRVGGGTILTSLFAATDASNLSDSLAVQMVELFAGDIDFHRQLRRGDTFSVVYEALVADDQPITWGEGTGRILAAEFVNSGKVHQVLWYTDSSGKGEYFGADGQSRRRTFLASPMAFSRITSGFAMRMHPIQNVWRAHRGVDYSAPLGTPVRSVGEGWVEFVGWQNGYGNVVQIEHGNDRSTLYAHLSQVDVRRGQRIEQGQRIGAVGATGWATGPHLHFEFRVHGQYQDPGNVAKASESIVITASARPRFENSVREYQRQLEVADSLRDAPGLGE